MNKLRKMSPYLLICAIAFYIAPILDIFKGFIVSTLICFFPTVCLGVALFYGIKNGYDCVFSIVIAILFIPSVFIYYDELALIYVFIYGIISFVGNLVGTFIRRLRR